ncbi:hypothetical protein N7516_010639 [Penicillium verrucosum]|uniref:uncharacterized protein n=1 Tax=Penicillium verrucosum TaxID=60171 RepID=UPI0025459535|nr:uncharacterized protein N7516_010639 [Penicillium verrucosum]KAJ5922936.1 hypothetical protein N7516_010639 [Penicillium verrucosum]
MTSGRGLSHRAACFEAVRGSPTANPDNDQRIRLSREITMATSDKQVMERSQGVQCDSAGE